MAESLCRGEQKQVGAKHVWWRHALRTASNSRETRVRAKDIDSVTIEEMLQTKKSLYSW